MFVKAALFAAVHGNLYFFIFGSKMNDARYPKISAADIPTALASKPPMKTPINPCIPES